MSLSRKIASQAELIEKLEGDKNNPARRMIRDLVGPINSSLAEQPAVDEKVAYINAHRPQAGRGTKTKEPKELLHDAANTKKTDVDKDTGGAVGLPEKRAFLKEALTRGQAHAAALGLGGLAGALQFGAVGAAGGALEAGPPQPGESNSDYTKRVLKTQLDYGAKAALIGIIPGILYGRHIWKTAPSRRSSGWEKAFKPRVPRGAATGKSAKELKGILGIGKDVTTKADAKRLYRKKSLTVHPDRNPAPDAKDKFQELASAWEEFQKTPDFNKLAQLFMKKSSVPASIAAGAVVGGSAGAALNLKDKLVGNQSPNLPASVLEGAIMGAGTIGPVMANKPVFVLPGALAAFLLASLIGGKIRDGDESSLEAGKDQLRVMAMKAERLGDNELAKSFYDKIDELSDVQKESGYTVT